MYAIEEKKLENVKLLLDCGANVEKTDKCGKRFRVLLGEMISKKTTFGISPCCHCCLALSFGTTGGKTRLRFKNFVSNF